MPQNNERDDVNDTSLVDDSTLRKKRALFALGICPDDEEESESAHDSVDDFSSIGSNEYLPPPPPDSPNPSEPAERIEDVLPSPRILAQSRKGRNEIPRVEEIKQQPPPPPRTTASSAPQIMKPAVKPKPLPQQKPSLVPLAVKRRCVETDGSTPSSRQVIAPAVNTIRVTEMSGSTKPSLSRQSNNTLAYLDFLKSIEEISKREEET